MNKNRANETNRKSGDLERLELRSAEVQEILTRPPHTLIRYGISIICGILLVLFIGSFFFRYPDIVEGEVVITTENPPVWLVAKASGKIKELHCCDKENVSANALLAVIENSASTTDVQKVVSLLKTVSVSDSACNIPSELLNASYNLGDMQSAFSSFGKNAVDYTNFLSFNLIEQEKSALQKQIKEHLSYVKRLNKQLELKEKELKIAHSAYCREEKLFKAEVISSSAMEIAEQTYLSQQQAMQQLHTTLSQAEITVLQLEEQVQKLSVQYVCEKSQLLANLKSNYQELLSSIEYWQQTYLLIAPENGMITFNSFWKENQFIAAGEKVFAIVSEHPGNLIGKALVPDSGSGKVKTGQQANIKIAGYPYMEYGILRAKVDDISLVANDNFYSVKLELPEGLRTSVHKELEFTGELTGTAEIITENRSLMERLFAPLKYLSNRYF